MFLGIGEVRNQPEGPGWDHFWDHLIEAVSYDISIEYLDITAVPVSVYPEILRNHKEVAVSVNWGPFGGRPHNEGLTTWDFLKISGPNMDPVIVGPYYTDTQEMNMEQPFETCITVTGLLETPRWAAHRWATPEMAPTSTSRARPTAKATRLLLRNVV